MSVSIATKYAARTLFRQRRRTLLSILGVSIGCASSLVTVAYVKGEGELIIRAAAETGTGHLKITPAGWAERRENDLRLDDWEAQLKALRQTEEVRVATPRSRANGLLAAGTRLVGVEIVGVDPETEQASNRLVRNVTAGRYLTQKDARASFIPVVVGQTIADRLDVELDDELMLTLSDATGNMRSAMLRIVGLVATGSREVDTTICQIPLPAIERLTGREGAGEIAVLLHDHRRLESFTARLRNGVAAPNEVLTWGDLSPTLRDSVKIDESFTMLTTGLVLILVMLGIASAQLTGILERRREFAVLSALGMKDRQMVHLILIESIVVGACGAALGLTFALPPVYLLATYGVDLRWFIEGELVVSNILIEPILYGDMGPWLIAYALGISFTATTLASIYPAWFATRADPASALRVV